MKNFKTLSLALLTTSLLSSSLIHAQESGDEKAAKEKKRNMTTSILSLVQENHAIDSFRVYINQTIVNTGDVVVTDEQFVDESIHRNSEGKKVGELTERNTAGKIVATDRGGEDIYVSFDPSCVSKSCAYHFEPNGLGNFVLTTSPIQGESNNGHKVKILGISVPEVLAPAVKLQYFETDIRKFSSEIKVNKGW